MISSRRIGFHVPWLLAIAIATLWGGESPAWGQVTFATFGDWGDGNLDADNGVTRVSSMVHAINPNFVVTVGDNNYGSLGVGHAHWTSYMGQYYGDYMLGRVDNAYPVQTSPTQRFFPAVGNHDSGGPGADSATGGTLAGYLDFFHSNPGGSTRLPTGSHNNNESYYDFTSGNTRFWVVDSDHAKASATSRLAQQQWLRTGLESSTSEWNFVFFHHAALTSGSSHSSDPALQWPYQAWGADAVFAGHVHNYERILRNGFPYFVAGAGGFDHDGFNAPISGSIVRNDTDFGAMLTTVNGSQATFEFRGVDIGSSTGTTLDTFSITHTATAVTTSFRQGVAGYASAVDTHIRLDSPATSFGATTPLVSDLDDNGAGGNQPSQVLIRFDDLFGAGSGQILTNATIVAATLGIVTGANSGDESGATTSLYRMLQPWTDADSWNTMAGGVTADGLEAVAIAESTVSPTTAGVEYHFDVTSSLQLWLTNPALNLGWVLLPNGTDGWRFGSSESAAAGNRPYLSVTYTVPFASTAAVPEPTGIVVFSLAMASLIAIRRRRGRLI